MNAAHPLAPDTRRESPDPDDGYLAELAAASRHLGAPLPELRRLLAPIRARQIPLPQVAGLLRLGWQRLCELRAQRAEVLALAGSTQELASSCDAAWRALGSGDGFSLEDADRALARAEGLDTRGGASAELAGRLCAARAQLAAVALDYPRAAARFAEAGATPGLSSTLVRRYCLEQARALQDQGREFVDDTALEQAIDLLQGRGMSLSPRDEAPAAWAEVLGRLGSARLTLGRRRMGTRMLEEAIEALEQALAVLDRQAQPLARARTRRALGEALGLLAQRQADTGMLERAAAVLESALADCDRLQAPHEWARTGNDLGTVLLELGRRQNDKTLLKRASEAYRQVLEVWTREHAPLAWAATLDNLGTALRLLGEHRKGPRTLEQSVAAYRSALAERTRARVPEAWALTRNNLGAALHRLGERQQDPDALAAAIEAYGQALAERTRERDPMTWAMTLANQAAARKSLAELLQNAELAGEALAGFRAVAEVFRAACHARYYELVTEQVALTTSLVQRLAGVPACPGQP